MKHGGLQLRPVAGRHRAAPDFVFGGDGAGRRIGCDRDTAVGELDETPGRVLVGGRSTKLASWDKRIAHTMTPRTLGASMADQQAYVCPPARPGRSRSAATVAPVRYDHRATVLAPAGR